METTNEQIHHSRMSALCEATYRNLMHPKCAEDGVVPMHVYKQAKSTFKLPPHVVYSLFVLILKYLHRQVSSTHRMRRMNWSTRIDRRWTTNAENVCVADVECGPAVCALATCVEEAAGLLFQGSSSIGGAL